MSGDLDPVWAAMCDGRFTGSETKAWPARFFRYLVDTGIIVEAAAATHVECDACSRGHVERVDAVRTTRRAARFYHNCPEAGRVEVIAERLRQWKVSIPALAQVLAAGFKLSGDAPKRLAGNVWQLGRLSREDGGVDIFLAPRVSDLAAAGIKPPAGATVLLGRLAPGPTPTLSMRAVPLANLVSFQRGKVAFDHARLAGESVPAPRGAPMIERRPDGVYEPRTIVYGGRPHDCEMTAMEAAFLRAALFVAETDIGALMHGVTGAVWREGYSRTKRNRISQLLTRVGNKLLAASPPLRVKFVLLRGMSHISRLDFSNGAKAPSRRSR